MPKPGTAADAPRATAAPVRGRRAPAALALALALPVAAVLGSLVLAGCGGGGGGAAHGAGEGSRPTAAPAVGSAAVAPTTSSSNSGATPSRSSTPAAASSKALPLATVCSQLKETLATGPSPARNALGSAKAQIIPLTRVQSSDTALLATLRTLVRADEALIRAKGHDATALAQIAGAKRSLASICPSLRS